MQSTNVQYKFLQVKFCAEPVQNLQSHGSAQVPYNCNTTVASRTAGEHYDEFADVK